MHKLAGISITVLAVAALASCTEPSTYEGVARLPRNEQLAAFVAASPVEKAAIYREHFTHYAARPSVTAQQREALLRSAVLVSPDWYALAPNAPGWAERVEVPRAEMERVVRAAFGADASRVMMTIGPE